MKKNHFGLNIKIDIKDSIKFTVGSVVIMMKSLLIIFSLSGCLSSEIPTEGPSLTSQCRTYLTLDRVFDKLIHDENIQLSDGVKFVKVNETFESERGRSSKDSILTRVKRFFSNYELQIKLSDIFKQKQSITDTLRRAVKSLNDLQGGNEETSRGKGNNGLNKKGGGAILMMATMMAGTMAALGFGALGMLVMKALTVSAMALLLSAVIGLRRLLRRPDDDAGFGRISYIPVHTEHRRRRRSAGDLPYRAYINRRDSSTE